MRPLNYLRMIYLSSFFGAKEENRTSERCIFVERPTGRKNRFGK